MVIHTAELNLTRMTVQMFKAQKSLSCIRANFQDVSEATPYSLRYLAHAICKTPIAYSSEMTSLLVLLQSLFPFLVTIG